jgi:hypothetical protein
MERIIRVSYVKPATNENEIGLEKYRDYYTNTDTLEQAIEIVRIESQKTFFKLNITEILSIEEVISSGINIT